MKARVKRTGVVTDVVPNDELNAAKWVDSVTGEYYFDKDLEFDYRDSELLLKDLCARIPYHTKVEYRGGVVDFSDYHRSVKWDACRPFLRRMSDMTDNERRVLASCFGDIREVDCVNIAYEIGFDFPYDYLNYKLEWEGIADAVDFCNRNHLDWRGLIDKGLATEAPEDMYNY